MSYQRGNRVYYDSLTGKKLWETGEIFESPTPMPHDEIIGEIKFIDLDINSIDVSKFHIVSIDTETLQPILQKHPWVEDELTPEELIAKMEEELALIKAEQELGGIA